MMKTIFLTLLVLSFGLFQPAYQPKETTLSVTLDFFTVGGPAPSPDCPAPHNFLNTQAGAGTGTDLGDFTTNMSFCVDPSEAFDSTITDKRLPYINAEGVFVAENGDELYVNGQGVVETTSRPGYAFEFQDTFYVAGGTGRYLDASGMLITDSYNRGDTTDHVWSGTIIMASE